MSPAMQAHLRMMSTLPVRTINKLEMGHQRVQRENSMEKYNRVIDFHKRGYRQCDICRLLKLPKSMVSRYIRRDRYRCKDRK